MFDPSATSSVEEGAYFRQLEPRWNHGLIVASIAISLLGAFTSCQLMCQARMSLRFPSVCAWTLGASLTFGWCSIWSLHFVAMLAFELDLPIGINVGLTVLSSMLAVLFTFAALGSDLLWDKWNKNKNSTGRFGKTRGKKRKRGENSSKILLHTHEQENRRYNDDIEQPESPSRFNSFQEYSAEADEAAVSSADSRSNSPNLEQSTVHGNSAPLFAEQSNQEPLIHTPNGLPQRTLQSQPEYADSSPDVTDSLISGSRRSSSFMGSNASSFGISHMVNVAYQTGTSSAKNVFVTTGEVLYAGCTFRNIVKGLVWSIAITSMHYVGISALRIPNGYYTLSPPLVLVSAAICWAVCLVGCILFVAMEVHLTQQVLFSVAATTGVAAMHFTGMRAARFWSSAPPSEERGYPAALPIAIVSIAITTCIAANGLLAHSATVSRNKLAEIIWTRRKLWRTIAQKENAEAAAAARSDWIASASHEIRTPLHHLQGYSDLLGRTELTEEGRMLLYAIQRATKTLSLITNNVLDWSKLEKSSSEMLIVALDIRTVCESVLVLLPNKDDEVDVELMLVVSPDVPHSLWLDETYIHRILMNLLSNALKFTRAGYILLLIEMENDKLIATVKDTGCGVPPSFLPQLFEPFKQAQTRGSQRGTGLGLSIIKQLLHKMHGSIDVESKNLESEDVSMEETGSTFTITIPVQAEKKDQRGKAGARRPHKVALLHGGSERALEGLHTAWKKFDCEVFVIKEISDLLLFDFKYVWADIPFLTNNPRCLRELLKRESWTVLVPYDTQKTLEEIPAVLTAPHFFPLQKPLVWHSFEQRIAAVPAPIQSYKEVRFAANVDIMDQDDKDQTQEDSTTKNLVILLVEDNPINVKLASKMLKLLKYDVMVAEDGQEAVDAILKHDATIDCVIMDQNMPRKDGLTASREIRAMEEAGVLSRRRPIIAVTAVVSPDAQEQFRAAGCAFLAKPLSLAKLEQTLALHLPSKQR